MQEKDGGGFYVSKHNLPLRVQITPGKGREYVASTSLASDQIVFRVHPFAAAIFDSSKKRVCAHCLCTHPTRFFRLHCTGCDQVYFCSRPCADQYLGDGTHQQLACGALRKLATLKADRHGKSVAKLVVLILWQRQRAAPMCEDATIPPTYDDVKALESHYSDWSIDQIQEWRRLHQFFTKHLGPLLPPNQTMTDIMHLVSRIESNGFGIFLEKALSNADPIGRAIYPLASLLNHSCDPNCEVEQCTEHNLNEEELPIVIDPSSHGPDDASPPASAALKKRTKKHMKQSIAKPSPTTYYPPEFTQPRGSFRMMLIRTLRSVPMDEPLTISYVDTSLPVAARRQKLLQDYYFECQCAKCLRDLDR
ncbi:uncharacterized protein BYT42DRAFT_580556 [Radiomyces spectabilis]|uniref:uncharacterized protein n=1 Tax=Radiomyces spectabilis TaxID=64574 RepID=UPI00221FB7E8|nr:uncharacterized protein BYT42DRAFT_580556 [Radiomyces spectabilis]KAI8371515.1 hypothetical protein BYT42DRAFT_580556 [Radiomyces spectabilis]